MICKIENRLSILHILSSNTETSVCCPLHKDKEQLVVMLLA
jgi:hypothetical protein